MYMVVPLDPSSLGSDIDYLGNDVDALHLGLHQAETSHLYITVVW